MRSSGLRGFLMSLDAIISIGLILTFIMFIAGLSITYSSPELRYQRLYYIGKDMISLLENAKIRQLQGFEVIQYYFDIGELSEDDLENTLLDVIGSMWASNNVTLQDYASNMTGQILNQSLPESYSYQVLMGGDSIYKRGPSDGEFLARLSTLISGVERGKPIDGYFARAYPAVIGSIRSKYYYFGGYVGEGNLTARMELPDYDTILGMSMELDAGDNFTLLINDNFAGVYKRQTNESMRSSSWQVDSSYFSHLHNGTNEIDIGFDHDYGYLGGGHIRIMYNISNLTAASDGNFGYNATKTFWLPGIEGIINLYDSIYVPGSLNEIEAYLHYENQIMGITPYVSLGNVEIFRSNETGEIEATLTNATIAGNLSDEGEDFSYLNSRTIPLRFGLENITYVFGEVGAADVALITDRTGSMEMSCDVDSSSCPYPDCDPSPGCQNERSDVAVDTDRIFVNNILGAPGKNYVGLIGYGERHGLTCSFHEISGNNNSLQQRIEDYNYGDSWQRCGYTCTSCGVVGATELLQENEVLYNVTRLEDIDINVYGFGGSVSQDVILTLNDLNKSRFIKSRLSILVREEDVVRDYYQCVFVNGYYLGRVCISSASSDDWHMCSYVVEEDWINKGSNTITLTRGNYNDCFTSASGSDYDFKDVKLTSWQYKINESVVVVNNSLDVSGINIIDHYVFANITENITDYPNPVDFTNGLNSTANTFGLGAGDDGWDWQSGTYDYSGTCIFDGAVNGSIKVQSDDVSDSSCAYGIEFQINSEIFSLIQSGASIAVSFSYLWVGNDDLFESSDQVWIKGRLTSPPGTTCDSSCYLGSTLDSGHWGGDGTFEIATENNPDNEMIGFFYQDVTYWIEETGTYYLDFGGKLNRNNEDEWGNFSFDDVAVSVYNSSGEAILHFSYPGVNMSFVKAATLSFDSRYIDLEKRNCVYVNENHVGAVDYQEINLSFDWQNVRFDVPVMYLTEEENEIKFTGGTDVGCNRSGDIDKWMVKNVQLSLVHSNETYPYRRKKSMLIMSDGDANTLIGDCPGYDNLGSCPEVPGWLTPYDETVQKACEAYDKYNISIYTVAFGNAGQDAEDMLREAACCENCSHYYNSSNADELQEIYSRIAQGIINASFEAQTIEVSEPIGAITTLFPDSYIWINYSSYIEPPEYGEITMNFESPKFETMSGEDRITNTSSDTKEGWFFIPSNVEVISAQVTSYSSQYWTDRLYIKNESTGWTRVYWLDDFNGDNYSVLGDPFTVNIPATHVGTGNNSILIGTGLSPTNGTGGSPDSRIIYTGRVAGITLEGYSDVYPKAQGSTFTVYYDIDGDNVSDGSVVVQIGPNPSDIFDPQNDSIDNAFMRLMNMLNVIWDPDPGGIGNGTSENPYDASIDNPIDFQITPDIGFDTSSIAGVPTMWGPVKIEVRVWV